MKYRVYGIMTASVQLGEYEASSAEEAKEMAEKDSSANHYPSLCYQCAGEVDLTDVYELQTEEAE